MLPTPDTSHVSYNRVYEPAEDSFLLLDTLSAPSETAFLSSRFAPATTTPPPPSSPSGAAAQPLLVLEVGPGSGVVLAFLTAHAARIFGTRAVLAAGADANPFACAATATTAAKAVSAARGDATAGLFLDAVQGDLASAFRRAAVDVLVFNPPYVPTPSLPGLPDPTTEHHHRHRSDDAAAGPNPSARREPTFEEESHLLELSYAGGRDGMETTDRLLASLPEVLSPRGCAYVLLCQQNRPEEVKARIRGWGPAWRAETVGTSGKTAGWEKLQIVRVWRRTSSEDAEGR